MERVHTAGGRRFPCADSSDIHDKATYFNSTKDGRGYNLLHLNALYDLESQVYLDAIIQDGREEHESQALVELVDRSELTEPVILVADRGYEAYNNMAHIEQKGWKYLIRVKDKQGLLSGLRLTGAPEFDAAFSYSLSKRLTNRIRQEPHKYRWIPKRFISTILGTQAMHCIQSLSVWSDLR